jgi:hypothetical protein
MLFALITAWLAYKRATANGKNGILWGAIGLGTFIGTQLLVGLGIGILLAVGVALLNWPESVFDDYTWPINIIAIGASFFTSWLLLRFLDRQPEVGMESNSPILPPENKDFTDNTHEPAGSAADNEH